MFYVLFGLAFGGQQIDGVRQSAYLLATYGTFGVMGASLFGTGASMAAERGLGWMQVKRASPMPPFAYFGAKIAVSVVFSSLVVVLLTILGLLFGGVHMAPPDVAKLLATLIKLTDTFKRQTDKLQRTLDPPGGSADKQAKHFRDAVIPAMTKVRTTADELETTIPHELWPLATYREMLFIK